MYEGFPFSPPTRLIDPISATSTSITVEDPDVLPDAPNKATLGIDYNGETIFYATKVGNTLGGVKRGFDTKNGFGEAKAWSTGTTIGRYFNRSDQLAIEENIRQVHEDTLELESDTADLNADVASLFAPSIGETRIINDVSISDLQSVISSLPKRLTENVTINVLPGTTENDLVVEGFSGPCSLIVNGAGTIGQTRINKNTNVLINLLGFTVESGTDVDISISFNLCDVVITHFTLIQPKTTGIDVNHAYNCTIVNSVISNKTHAIVAAHGNSVVDVLNLSGQNNSYLYTGHSTGRVAIRHEGIIQCNTAYALSFSGGQVIDSLGRTRRGNDILDVVQVESGAWTPTLTSFNGMLQLEYSIQRGSYYKIGKMCHYTLYISGSVVQPTSPSYPIIYGLPFGVSNGIQHFAVSEVHNALGNVHYGASGRGAPVWTSHPASDYLFAVEAHLPVHFYIDSADVNSIPTGSRVLLALSGIYETI